MYFTFKTSNKEFEQLTFEDFFRNFGRIIERKQSSKSSNYYNTKTLFITDQNLLRNAFEKHKFTNNIIDIAGAIERMNEALPNPLESYYETFQIPKHSGGMREINAPTGPLKVMQYKMLTLLQDKFMSLPHNSAYAYVPGRSTKDALEVHQKNNSKWFLHLDIKDFFPSCNQAFVQQQLKQIFPYGYLTNQAFDGIMELLKVCFLNDALPQGTPVSPFLTNLIMLPIDDVLSKHFKDFAGQNFVYTRYADDIILSCKYAFDYLLVENTVDILFTTLNTPFKLKRTKTHYGSSAGRNWNLGLMLNKDNNITIGYKKKERIRATLHAFIMDLKNGNHWSIIRIQEMQGLFSYYSKIEPEFVKDLFAKYSTKFECNVKQLLKQELKR